MPRRPFALQCLLSILLAGALMISTHGLWAQESPPAQLPVSLFDPPIGPAPERTADAPERRLPETLLPTLQASQGQSGSQLRFFPRYAGYDPIALDEKRGLQLPRPAAMAEGPSTDFAGCASSRWWTVAPAFGKRREGTARPAQDPDHYVHHIPWASPIILRVGQQAKAHPNLTRVLKLLMPSAP